VPWQLYGRTVRKTAGIICDECLQIIQMVPPKDLQRELNAMELQVEAAQSVIAGRREDQPSADATRRA